MKPKPRYTHVQGACVIAAFRLIGFPRVTLIGSLGKGLTSNHDIDILLPKSRKTKKLIEKLTTLLKPKKVSHTDWGGLYFHDCIFGDVDVFFTTKDFDY